MPYSGTSSKEAGHVGVALPATAARRRARLRHAATRAGGRGRAVRRALLRQAVRWRN